MFAALRRGQVRSGYDHYLTHGTAREDGFAAEAPRGHGVSGVGEARDQAIAAAGEMIKLDANTVWNGSAWMMNVTDETGAAVFTLRTSATPPS